MSQLVTKVEVASYRYLLSNNKGSIYSLLATDIGGIVILVLTKTVR